MCCFLCADVCFRPTVYCLSLVGTVLFCPNVCVSLASFDSHQERLIVLRNPGPADTDRYNGGRVASFFQLTSEGLLRFDSTEDTENNDERYAEEFLRIQRCVASDLDQLLEN